jgi:peptide/nickel transport system substrate-binding protein
VSDQARKRAERAQVDRIRRQSSEVQNHIIDEYEAKKISRRDFIRRGSIVGMSLPVLGFLAAACGDDDDVTPTTAAPAATDAPPAATDPPAAPVTIRVGINPTPSVGIEPVLINDEAGLAVLGQSAQYLVFSDDELNAVPVLAESWQSNAAGDVWTFTLREGVTFQDGTPLTAADVVATFNGPIADGNAASAYGTFGVTNQSAAAIDDRTVQFTLDAPNGAFPFFVSSDNYNAAILPASFWQNYAEGSYEQSFIGTGPWVNVDYEPGISATYEKNTNYWGDNMGQPDRMEILFFADEASSVTAFQEGRIDLIHRISASGGAALINDPNANVQSISTAQHRQVYFDTRPDPANPFGDKRVRQAMALMLNRPVLIEGLLDGFGVAGNDHPIWQNFPMYDPNAVAQRTEDLAAAQGLLDAAGFGDGFDAPLDTLEFNEVPALAQLIQASAAQLNNVNLSVGVYDSGTYYGDYWLAAQNSMGIVHYGHRGVPNVYLGAPLLSGERGTWNASHWENADYDALFDQFVSAPDLDTQRQIAGQIQVLLNDEVPFIVPYFLDFISVTKPGLTGLETTGMGHYSVVNAAFTG